MTLVVGLGNPGDKYKNSRHNIGFLAIDNILSSQNPTSINNSYFNAKLYKIQDILYLKPQTFMNHSGQSVEAVKRYYKLKNSDIIVIHDDLDLPFGSLRFKKGGGAGGHNGLKSIDTHIGKDYIRIRVGIEKPISIDISNYVLSNFNSKQKEYLNNLYSSISNSIEAIIDIGLEKTSSLYSIKKPKFNETS